MMDDTTYFVLAGVILVCLLIFLRVMANKDNVLGRICRWYWNFCFKLLSIIPIIGGLFAPLIIGKDKDIYIDLSEKVNAWAYDTMSTAADRARAQQNRENAIRSELASRGYVDVSVNGDGTFATAKDKKGNSYNVHIKDE